MCLTVFKSYMCKLDNQADMKGQVPSGLEQTGGLRNGANYRTVQLDFAAQSYTRHCAVHNS